MPEAFYSLVSQSLASVIQFGFLQFLQRKCLEWFGALLLCLGEAEGKDSWLSTLWLYEFHVMIASPCHVSN